MATYSYDRRTNRFRDEGGQFVSKSRVMTYLGDSLEAAGAVTDQLAGWVAGDDENPPTITPEDWRDMLKGEVKREHIRQALLGRGGGNEMTPRDWGALGNLLANNTDGGEYQRIDQFYLELLQRMEEGTLTAEWVAARSRLYFGAARQTYERMNTRAHGIPADLPSYPGDKHQSCWSGCKCEWHHEKIRDGADRLVEIQSKWVLEPSAEHCEPGEGTRGCAQNAREYNPYITRV